MSELDNILDNCTAIADEGKGTQRFWELVAEPTKVAVKELMLDLIERSVYTKRGSPNRYIDEQELIEFVEAL